MTIKNFFLSFSDFTGFCIVKKYTCTLVYNCKRDVFRDDLLAGAILKLFSFLHSDKRNLSVECHLSTRNVSISD